MATQILMPALPVAGLDPAIHSARIDAPTRLYAQLDGPLLRAMTREG